MPPEAANQTEAPILDADLSAENWRDAARAVLESLASTQRFEQRLERLGRVNADDLSPAERRRHLLTLGIGRLILGRLDAALEALRALKADPEALRFAGQALAAKGDLAGAAECVEKASAKDDAAALEQAEALLLLGRIEEAQGILKGPAGKRNDPDARYVRGLLLDLQGEYDEARSAYEEALVGDSTHAPSLFRLAYNSDLRGNDEEALEYYERCLQGSPTHLQAWVNLGLLYEDRGQHDRALRCFERVLAVYPEHSRAALFAKDAEGSLHMYYDHDKDRRRDLKTAILDTPIADFELSVRSRNCLAKMNIRTIGDLVKRTERDLLSYKNFGDTSLQEIKQLLSQKGLRLGQGAEGEGEIPLPEGVPREILTRSIAELALSIKVQNALQKLGVATFSDLLHRSQQEFLTLEDVGEPGVQEIQQRLSTYSLSLKRE